MSWNDSGWSSWFRNSSLLWTFPLSKTTKQFERVENLRLVQGLFLWSDKINRFFLTIAPVYCLNSKTFPTMKHQVDLISFSKILLALFRFSWDTPKIFRVHELNPQNSGNLNKWVMQMAVESIVRKVLTDKMKKKKVTKFSHSKNVVGNPASTLFSWVFLQSIFLSLFHLVAACVFLFIPSLS